MGSEQSVLTNGDIGRVMVGTDRSETATRAVAWAAAFAERYGAELHVVQVILPANPADTEFGAAERSQATAAAGTRRRWAGAAAAATWWSTTIPRWPS